MSSKVKNVNTNPSGTVASAATAATVTTAANTSTNSLNKSTSNQNISEFILPAQQISPQQLETLVKDIHVDENEKRIISEFIHLLEKSKQLFNGLRDLPQYGYKTSQWQLYFARTFDVYTKLWKFQQLHRQVLDSKYSLKRWQIGEIASKIGQLYYHYYLRTSESNYLNESYSFYHAIQSRAYYSKVNKEEKPDLMVKKLRYLARFIVVCLLLKKTKQVKDLIKDLNKQIDEYVKIYDPEDQLEWQLVKNEISDFIDADNIFTVDNITVSTSSRLNVAKIPAHIAANPSLSLTLTEIIIIGNCQNQIKFSELSMDMFRMLQAVEREPSVSIDKQNENELPPGKSPRNTLYLHEMDKLEASTSSGNYNPLQRENPRKYLLYKPTFSQSLAYMSSAFKDLPPHSVLLIYISADACESHTKLHIEAAYDKGGVRTSNKKDTTQSSTTSATPEFSFKKSSHLKDVHCIYPGDLYAFLRKPLFLIVDSFNSAAFQNFPHLFGQPFAALLSPMLLPTIFQENQHKGSIFTLFLASPIQAFCYICNITNIPNKETIDKAQNLIDLAIFEIGKALTKSKQLDYVYLQFYADEFLRTFILRFLFCYFCLKLHRGFKGPEYYPNSEPRFPNEILDSIQLQRFILDLSTIFNIRQLFLDINENSD